MWVLIGTCCSTDQSMLPLKCCATLPYSYTQMLLCTQPSAGKASTTPLNKEKCHLLAHAMCLCQALCILISSCHQHLWQMILIWEIQCSYTCNSPRIRLLLVYLSKSEAASSSPLNWKLLLQGGAHIQSGSLCEAECSGLYLLQLRV